MQFVQTIVKYVEKPFSCLKTAPVVAFRLTVTVPFVHRFHFKNHISSSKQT